MLSLPNDGRYPALELAPQQRRENTLEALSDQMQVLSRSNPVLMIFEDVHWIDPTSLEALSRIVDRLSTLGALLVITFRPDFEAPWIGRPCITSLTLNRLGKSEIAAMIDRLTGNEVIPQSVRQDIIERTDGIPLFVEEMIRAVLEAESDRAPRYGRDLGAYGAVRGKSSAFGIARLGYTTPSSIVRWRRDSAQTLVLRFRAFVHWPFGVLAFLRLRSQMLAVRLKKHARLARRPR
jgi:hypothetical protein